MGFCNRNCLLVTFSIVFLAVAIFSGLIYVITNPLVEEGLAVEFVVDSEESPRFADWACKFTYSNDGPCAQPHHSVPFFERYFMFNLTNLDEVLNGGRPKYTEHGPYTYRDDIFKYDIEFKNDGEIVEYGQSHTYIWTPEESCDGCSPTDTFIGINPGYLGAIDVAVNEQVLVLGMGGPVMGEIIQKIHDTFIQAIVAQDGEEYWLERCQERDRDCETTFDMAIVQFGYYKLRAGIEFGLNNTNLTEWNNELFPTIAEYGVMGVTNEWSIVSAQPITIEIAQKLLYGPKGIVEGPLYLLEIIGATLNVTDEDLEETWGLNRQGAIFLGLYVVNIRETYSLDAYYKATVLDYGGGLFSRRNVHQWVFDFADPLLLYMQPGDPQTAIRRNDTSVEDSRSWKPGKNGIKTGKNDLRNIANVTLWNGTDTIPFWSEPVPVFGNNQDGQFFFQLGNGLGKLPSKLEDYDIWSPDHGKTVYLEDTGSSYVNKYGIKLNRYVLKNDTYEIDPVYYGSIYGFINATFHMDPPFRDRKIFGAFVPLFFSQPYMWGGNDYYYEKVEFIGSIKDLDHCATIIDVEPISGNGMLALKRLQVNFYVSNTAPMSKFHPNLVNDTFFPLLYLTQEAEVTAALAEEWDSELGSILDIIDIIFVAGLSIGIIGFVLCTGAYVYYKKRSTGYQSIN